MTEKNEDFAKFIASLKSDVAKILASHGIRMSVWGCGCCDSPDVRFEYKGKLIVEESGFCFDMFNDDFKGEK